MKSEIRKALVAFMYVPILAFSINPAKAAGSPYGTSGTLVIVAQNVGSPDDIAVASDGTIYFSDLNAHRVMRITPDGKAEAVSPALPEPEGLIVLPDGTLIVAEQQDNRLYRLDPATQNLTLFYDVGNRTTRPGIDGISQDSSTGDILVPDSPSGRILRISADGQKEAILLTGFVRPTGVALAKDGTLYVCDEYGNAIYSVTPDGKRTIIARMSLPDDVVLDSDGSLLVNSLDGLIWHVDPVARLQKRLVVDLSQPHGLALDSQDNPVIADAGYGKIFRLILHQPSTPAATQSATVTP